MTEVIVSKVGRKYFTVTDKSKLYSETQYFIETWKEKYGFSVQSILYVNEQEYIDEKESDELYKKIREAFKGYKNSGTFTLDRLKNIIEIIKC